MLSKSVTAFCAPCCKPWSSARTRSVFYCVQPRWIESKHQKDWGIYVSLETQGSVHCKWVAIILQQVDKFKYVGVANNLRVTEGGVRRLIHGLVKLTQFRVLRDLYHSLWSRNRSFQTPQSSQFLNWSLFRSLPSLSMVMYLGLWLTKYYLKYKQQKCDFCKE